MKLSIKEAEALLVLTLADQAKRLGLDYEPEVKIEAQEPVNSFDFANKVIQEVKSLDHKHSQKIEAIKRVRRHTNLSLTDAKSFVERIDEMERYVTAYFALPVAPRLTI